MARSPFTKAYRVERAQKVIKGEVRNPYTGLILEPEVKEDIGPFLVNEYEMYAGDAKVAAAQWPEWHLTREKAEKHAERANAEMKAAEKLASRTAKKDTKASDDSESNARE